MITNASVMNIKQYNPYFNLIEAETLNSFLNFCTFVFLINGKKLNLANIFLLCLKNSQVKSMLKETLGIENDYAALKIFFEFDPTLYKSKYIMKYINKNLC
jgi:hypothetical protein